MQETWDRIYTVNVNGVFLTMKYVVPVMKKAGSGSIINLASDESSLLTGTGINVSGGRGI